MMEDIMEMDFSPSSRFEIGVEGQKEKVKKPLPAGNLAAIPTCTDGESIVMYWLRSNDRYLKRRKDSQKNSESSSGNVSDFIPVPPPSPEDEFDLFSIDDDDDDEGNKGNVHRMGCDDGEGDVGDETHVKPHMSLRQPVKKREILCCDVKRGARKRKPTGHLEGHTECQSQCEAHSPLCKSPRFEPLSTETSFTSNSSGPSMWPYEPSPNQCDVEYVEANAGIGVNHSEGSGTSHLDRGVAVLKKSDAVALAKKKTKKKKKTERVGWIGKLFKWLFLEP